jgi:hypothetical protein
MVFGMIDHACHHVQLADAVHHASQHGFVGIDLGAIPGEHIGERGHQGAVLPQIVEKVLQAGQLVSFANLRHREGHRGAAHHVVADPVDRRPQVRDRAAAAIERRRICDPQQPRRQRGFGSHHPDHLIDGGFRIRQNAPHPQRNFRE